MRMRAGHRGVSQRHLAADGIDDGLPAALVRDMQHVKPGALLEKFTRHMRGAAGSGVAERKLAWVGL